MPTQRNIASTLKLLDDKIALNNKIIQKLEQIAKALYSYWFIQFDFPDDFGRPYKSSGGKMVYNDTLKREIPAGWEVKNFNKYATIGSGFPFKSKEYSEAGDWKIITIKNVQDGYLDLSTVNSIKDLPDKLPNFVKLKIGDVLISLTGNVGRMCLVDSNNLLLNQRVGKILTNDGFLHFAYLFLSNAENKIRLEHLSNGSSQQNLSPIQAVSFYFAVPSSCILRMFNLRIDAIYKKVLQNKQENIRLANIRDFLLPMLMNGQITVSD